MVNGASTVVKAPTDASYWEVINNVGDPVRYNTVQSLSASQQLQARTNIDALGIGEFNTQGGVKFATDSDFLQLLSTNDNILSKIPWQTIPNVYSRNKPVVTDILWSGDLDLGDLNLSEDFTNYDVLMFMGGGGDTSPGSTQMLYNFVPVWFLKQCIIDHSFMGVSIPAMELVLGASAWWRMDCANSTTTVLKYQTDGHVHMWRVIGIRYTSSVSPQAV